MQARVIGHPVSVALDCPYICDAYKYLLYSPDIQNSCYVLEKEIGGKVLDLHLFSDCSERSYKIPREGKKQTEGGGGWENRER